MLKTLILTLTLLATPLLEAKPKSENLNVFGRQLVELKLRGSEVLDDQRVKKMGCWSEDIAKLPNVYITHNSESLGDDDLNIPYFRVPRNVKIISRGISLNNSSITDTLGEPLIDYLKKGTFTYSYLLKVKDQYIYCDKRVVKGDTSYCQKLKLTKDVEQASQFEVHGQVFQPTETDMKERFDKKERLPYIVYPVGPDDKLGVVYQDCIQKASK